MVRMNVNSQMKGYKQFEADDWPIGISNKAALIKTLVMIGLLFGPCGLQARSDFWQSDQQQDERYRGYHPDSARHLKSLGQQTDYQNKARRNGRAMRGYGHRKTGVFTYQGIAPYGYYPPVRQKPPGYQMPAWMRPAPVNTHGHFDLSPLNAPIPNRPFRRFSTPYPIPGATGMTPMPGRVR